MKKLILILAGFVCACCFASNKTNDAGTMTFCGLGAKINYIDMSAPTDLKSVLINSTCVDIQTKGEIIVTEAFMRFSDAGTHDGYEDYSQYTTISNPQEKCWGSPSDQNILFFSPFGSDFYNMHVLCQSGVYLKK